jgi:hypothetical protein
MRDLAPNLLLLAARHVWAACLLLTMGCQSMSSDRKLEENARNLAALGKIETDAPFTPIVLPFIATAAASTDVSQAAFQPIASSSPRQDRTPAGADALTLAMDCLNRGQEEKACEHLRHYVAAHPDRKQARAFYAEVLVKLDRLQEARLQFEEIIAASMQGAAPDLLHLVHSHGRIVELSERNECGFDAHLHRGLGLYWLARQRKEIGEPDLELPHEVILVKSATELQNAFVHNPFDARVSVYLHSIWKQLGQGALAVSWLYRAREATLFSPLHSTEQHQLEIAYRSRMDQGWARR